MEEDDFGAMPDISWDVLDHQDVNDLALFYTTPLPVSTTGTRAKDEPPQKVTAIQGVLLFFFILLLLVFFLAQIVIYFKHFQKSKSKKSLSRRFRPTKTLTFQNKRNLARAYVLEASRRQSTHSSGRTSIYNKKHSRNVSGTSEISYIRTGPSTAGSLSRSSFSSATFFLGDTKSNSNMSQEVTLDLMETGSGISGTWSDGTIGHYSLSSAFVPCENPAFETESSTSSISSRSLTVKTSSDSTSSCYTMYRPHPMSRQHRPSQAYLKRLGSSKSSRSRSSRTSANSTSTTGRASHRSTIQTLPRGSHNTESSSDSSFTSVSSISALSTLRIKKNPSRRSVKWEKLNATYEMDIL